MARKQVRVSDRELFQKGREWKRYYFLPGVPWEGRLGRMFMLFGVAPVSWEYFYDFKAREYVLEYDQEVDRG